eukprot:TRINITY_DN7999_c0_g1_i1.p1 TRINITY_DN7999_c0_g1~~TRINITY_DN7999_c0_g1_i1.p1  ORF type:complete len:458 (+),score=57.82 TRINITY_DN7999_c0_g1_i1:186-1559(+)
MADLCSPTSAQLDRIKRGLVARDQCSHSFMGPETLFFDDATLDRLTHDPTLMTALKERFLLAPSVIVHSETRDSSIQSPVLELDGIFLQLCARYHLSKCQPSDWDYDESHCRDRSFWIQSCDGPLPQLKTLLALGYFEKVFLTCEPSLEVINALHDWRRSLLNNDLSWKRCWRYEKSLKRCIYYSLYPSRTRASKLLADIVELTAFDAPPEQVRMCVQEFFATSKHRFHAVILESDVAVALPVVHTKHLHPSKFVTLATGSSVENCHISHNGGRLAFGNSCFHIQLLEAQPVWEGEVVPDGGWTALYRLTDNTQCVMLTLQAVSAQGCLQLPDHSLLQHVRMLRWCQETEREDDMVECKSLIQPFLARFPRLVVATATTCAREGIATRTQAQPLLHFYTICQHRLTLGDYGMLLRHEDLAAHVLQTFPLHLAAVIAGLEIPDAVSRLMLKAIVVMQP